MALRGTDPESCITEYTLVYEEHMHGGRVGNDKGPSQQWGWRQVGKGAWATDSRVSRPRVLGRGAVFCERATPAQERKHNQFRLSKRASSATSQPPTPTPHPPPPTRSYPRTLGFRAQREVQDLG